MAAGFSSAAQPAPGGGAAVEVVAVRQTDGYSLRGRNDWHGRVAVSVAFVERANLRPRPVALLQRLVTGGPAFFLLDPGVSRELYRLRQVAPETEARLSFRYHLLEGDPTAKPDDFLYYYPLRIDSRLLQGFSSRPTHSGAAEHSLDFGLSEGLSVHAAREGVVMRLGVAGVKGGAEVEGGGNAVRYARFSRLARIQKRLGQTVSIIVYRALRAV